MEFSHDPALNEGPRPKKLGCHLREQANAGIDVHIVQRSGHTYFQPTDCKFRRASMMWMDEGFKPPSFKLDPRNERYPTLSSYQPKDIVPYMKRPGRADRRAERSQGLAGAVATGRTPGPIFLDGGLKTKIPYPFFYI